MSKEKEIEELNWLIKEYYRSTCPIRSLCIRYRLITLLKVIGIKKMGYFWFNQITYFLILEAEEIITTPL